MAGIFVYEHDCHDFSTTGMVGELQPLECYFEEEKNGASGLSIRMYYDSQDRWKSLKAGNIIKAYVPVRVPPALVNGQYIDTVDISYINSLNLQQFAVKLDLQKHADYEFLEFHEMHGDKACTYVIRKIPFTGTGGRHYELIVYSDGTQVTKIVDPKNNTNGYTNKTVIKTDEQTIPQRFSGLEAAVIPTRIREQLFVIDSVVENEDDIEVTANHLWYQLLKNYTTYKPDETIEVSGYSACKNVMTNALSDVSSWSVESDVDTTLKGLDYNQKNIVETFLDPENGICAKYNAVLLRDNWDFYVIKKENIGYDRGFVVEYGQNMLNVERTESIENVATRIVPFGKDSKGNPVYMTGTMWVDSENIDDYPSIMVELLDCSKNCTIGKNGTTAQNITEKLRVEAQKRFDDDKVDLPEVEMTVNFLSLGDTEEYIQYRGLDKVYLYDKITIKDKKRGYNYAAEVNYVKHNVLTGQLEEVKIGSIENSDGVRKIATWQVPQVSGENIRLKSIQLGSFADGAVDEDAIANGAITTIHLASATIDDLTTESLQAVEAQIESLIAGKVTAGSIVAGAVTAEKIQAGAVTTEKIATGAITADSAIIAQGAIGDAQINSAGINYAKIKDLDAQSAYFGEAIFEDAIGGKLYVPRLLFETAQGRQMLVKDLVVGASNGLYYHLDITETDDGISMTPTQVTVTQGEIEDGHTSDGQPIIGTTATVDELATEDLFAIDALIDKITAKRLDVDELWARQAFISKLNVQDLSSNTYIMATVGSWSATHQNTIVDEIAGINRTIGQMGRGQIFFSTTEPTDPAVGDLWIKPTNRLTHADLADYTHAELAEFRYMDLGKPPEQYVYNGTGWEMVNDSSMYTVLQTQIEQTDEKIALKASQAELTLTNDRVSENEAQIEINAGAITNEVIARQSGDAASQAYADGVAATAEANAKSSSIQKTATYQTAESIVNSAKSYTDDQLTGYSTITQTSSAISAEVTKISNGTTPVGKLVSSKVTIDANGIQLKTNGTFTVASGNFSIDSNGNVTMKGNVQANAGTIGGWTIGSDSLHAGSGSRYVALSTSGDYFMWAGAASAASAPFRIKKDGTVYSTKLITVNEQGSESTIDLRNYSLWKLNYATVKSISVSGNTLTIETTAGTTTFRKAAYDQIEELTLSGTPSASSKKMLAHVVVSDSTSGQTFTMPDKVVDVSNAYNAGFADGEAGVRVRSITTGVPTVVYDSGTIYAFKDNASITLTNGVTDTSKGVGLQFTDAAGSGLAYDAGYKSGYNAALSDCGVPADRTSYTVYTGSESQVMIQGVGLKWVVSPYAGHAVSRK